MQWLRMYQRKQTKEKQKINHSGVCQGMVVGENKRTRARQSKSRRLGQQAAMPSRPNKITERRAPLLWVPLGVFRIGFVPSPCFTKSFYSC